MINDKSQNEPTPAEFLLYQTEDGQTRLEVRLQEETVWLTQKRMAELFQKNVRTINEHIQNIFDEGELTPEELDVLNRIVTAYLEFAELQALNRKPMYMEDWIDKLDDFLKLSGRELLTHAGTISHEKAIERAQLEYEKHRAIRINWPSPVEKHFEQAVKKLPRPGKGSR